MDEVLRFENGLGPRTFSDEQMAALLGMGPRLAESMDLAQVMQTAIESAVEVAGTRTGAIYLVDGDELYLGATTPPLPPDFPDELRRAQVRDHGIIARALSEQAPVYAEDLYTIELMPAERAAVEARDLRTVLYVPLFASGRPVGIFMVGSSGEVRPIRQTEAALCFALSGLIGLALRNARLYEAVSKSAAELETSLAEANEQRRQLRALATRITEAEETERRRLAEEIHDRVLQPLGVLKLYVDQCRAALDTDVLDDPNVASALACELEAADRILTTALAETRELMLETSPPSVDELGIERAIQWLADHMGTLGLTVDVTVYADAHGLDRAAQVILTRVVREALYNVVKHAGTKTAHVSLRTFGDEAIQLTVIDEGVGFDADRLQRLPDGDGGFGLFGLRERVAHAGGSLVVTTAPGEGTTVCVRLPL